MAFDPFVVFSIPRAVFRWLGALVGITNAPNIVLRDWKTGEIKLDPRPAWYHWLHVRCVNEQRGGWSRWLTTVTAIGCHAIVRFLCDGSEFCWDDVPFGGRVGLTYDLDLVVDDDRAFIPLFLELDHEVPDPRNPASWLQPGVYPTGKRFFGGLTEPLPRGAYSVSVSVLQGKRELRNQKWDGSIVVGNNGGPAQRSLSPLPSTYPWPPKPAGSDTTPGVTQRGLGGLLLEYEQLEREYLAQGWSEALSKRQTALHNKALSIIDNGLGRARWAQFKTAKKEPLVVPAVLRGDDSKLSLLYMIHGRIEWLNRTIDEIEPKS